MAWVKWFPGKNGAFKFSVQARWSTSNDTNRDVSDSAWPWKEMFSGPENTWKGCSLNPGARYQIRIISLNNQGNAAEPSEKLEFSTLDRANNKAQLTPKNVDSTFTVECTGDIVVGDTILITERLYAKATGAVEGYDSNGLSKAGNKKNVTKMNMSVTSIGAASVVDAPVGQYIGERTVAAHVVRDNFRSGREGLIHSGVGSEKFAKLRRLGLEVVWQQASSDACKPYELKSGQVVERVQSHLEQFEVFRCDWIQEKTRRSLKIEYGDLVDSYITNPFASMGAVP
jgi:hypothetical protein